MEASSAEGEGGREGWGGRGDREGWGGWRGRGVWVLGPQSVDLALQDVGCGAGWKCPHQPVFGECFR